jgi:hypothetical protein
MDLFIYYYSTLVVRVLFPLVEKGKKIKLLFFSLGVACTHDMLCRCCELALLPSTTVSLPGLAGAGVVCLCLQLG